MKHYLRKHSGHAALLGAGLAVGAASDIGISAMQDEAQPPAYYMEGGEDSITNIRDDSWNLVSVREITDQFTEDKDNSTGPEEMAYKGEAPLHRTFFFRLKVAFLMLLMVIFIYVLCRIIRNI